MQRRKSRNSTNWEPDECAGLGPTNDGKLIEKLIRAQLNPCNQKDGYFNLYYVVQRPGVPTHKTVLFCAGGPGEIVRSPIEEDTFASFLISNQYNVAFFHFRGAGFSQVPASNRYDKFLKTRYAAEDIERIRTDFLGKNGKWDAIIAWSYGTILAQQYAHYYSSKVEKLILLAPLSRHMFNGSVNGFDEFNEDVRRINRESLERILGAKEFEEELALKEGEKEKIVQKVFGDQNDPKDKGIFGKTENAFGSIQFVVDEYNSLSRRGVLKDFGIDMYGRNFFRQLRRLRLIGSSLLAQQTRQTREDQLAIGKEIRDEILDEKRAIGNSLDLHAQRSDRVFYTVGALDGINPRFLKEWLARGRKNLRAALNRSGGEAHIRSGVNSGLKKVNISNREKVKPWDPAKYRHDVATLILKGEADPVTAGRQAEHWFRNALSGSRTLIEFPGIGHNFRLPDPEERQHDDVPSGIIRFDPSGIRPGEIRAVTGSARGLKLKDKLHVTLTPPENLKSIVKVLSIGFVEEGKVLEPEKAKNNVIALITNRTSEKVKLNIQETYWHLSCHFFEGIVQINYWSLPDPAKHRLISGPITILPQGVVAVYGRVFHGGRNSSQLYHLQSEDELEEGLQTLGFFITEGGSVHLWLKATKRVENASAKKWTLSRGSFRKTFRVKPPPLMQEGEFVEIEETIDGLKFDLDEEITVTLAAGSEGRLDAYIPQEQIGEKIPILVTNTEEQGFNSKPGIWHIESPYFAAAVRIDPPHIPPKGAVKIHGTLNEFHWKKWLEIMAPRHLDPDLELMGFNILGEDKISLMVKNTGTKPIRGGWREWIYMDPSERAADEDADDAVSLRMRRPLLNRLIYSFLVMDPGRFADERQNESLKVSRTAFVDDARAFKIERPDRSVRRIDKVDRDHGVRPREKDLTTFRTIG
jgi:pimeloyl-ACP methyl ester carboxylesterase